MGRNTKGSEPDNVVKVRQVSLRLDPLNPRDADILAYLDNDLPLGKRELAVKQSLYLYIKSRRRNRQKVS